MIDNTEIKISLLADDITLILKDLNSVESTIKTLWIKNQYRKNKSKIYWKKTTTRSFSSWSLMDKNPYRNLGIHITNNCEENLTYNFKPKIATLKKHLAIWKQRSLSLKYCNN